VSDLTGGLRRLIYAIAPGSIEGYQQCHIAFTLEKTMVRRLLVAIATVAAPGTLLGVSSASADPYKWCAVYSMYGGGTNCGFVTIEQCRATISGIGGSCEPNQFYTGPDAKPAKTKRKRPH
jgi:hypothetical protein